MRYSSLHFNPTAILMSSSHPCSAPFRLLFLGDRDLELLFVTAHTPTHPQDTSPPHQPTEINKSIAVSAFEGKIDEAMIDWIFNLKYSPESWCVMHTACLLAIVHNNSWHSKVGQLLRRVSLHPTTRTTAKLSNRATNKTNFISSDYPGRYRFVLCLNKWKSINVVYGLLLRTSFSNPFSNEHFVLLEKFCFFGGRILLEISLVFPDFIR